MRSITLLLFTIFSILVAKAQNVNDFVNVYLQNGYTIKGVLIEIVPNSHLKIKLKNSEITEFKSSEIKKIEINNEENNKLKIQSEREAYLKKQAEETKKKDEEFKKQKSIQEDELRKQKILQEEEFKKQKTLLEEKRKREEEIKASKKAIKNQQWEKDLDMIAKKQYISIGVGGDFQFISDGIFRNLLNSYAYVVPVNNPTAFKGYEIFAEFDRNKSKNNNLCIAFNYSNTSSTVDYDNSLKMKFEFQKLTINMGHYYYLNKSLQLALGSGLSYTRNIASTDLEERGNVLIGRTNFYSVPVFVMLRYAPLLSNTPLSIYIKPSYVMSYLPAVSAFDAGGFAFAAGVSYILKK